MGFDLIDKYIRGFNKMQSNNIPTNGVIMPFE